MSNATSHLSQGRILVPEQDASGVSRYPAPPALSGTQGLQLLLRHVPCTSFRSLSFFPSVNRSSDDPGKTDHLTFGAFDRLGPVRAHVLEWGRWASPCDANHNTKPGMCVAGDRRA